MKFPSISLISSLVLVHHQANTVLVGASIQECEVVTLDFNNMRNPMAEYYNQTEYFQSGDYIYDQLAYEYGVTISARIRNDNPGNGKDRSDSLPPFIPLYDHVAKKWKSNKADHIINDYTTGGAVRLFDTARPDNFSGNPIENRNTKCQRNNVKEGDKDLGSPNMYCPGGGPGRGNGPNNGGAPTLSNGQPNPWANCNPLGLIVIIQEEDKDCEDDTSTGGFITFQFREPVALQLTSLLDIDEGGNSPQIHVYQNGVKSTYQTSKTGENGLFPLVFEPDEYSNVSVVDVEYWGSGSINSLQYKYCKEVPVPDIALIKYAGPPEACNAAGAMPGGGLEDVLYTVPSETDNWAYCYAISVPDSSEEECLYDVKLNDPAPMSGPLVDEVVPMDAMGKLCKGTTVYVAGPTKLGSDAPEGPIAATVTGKGYFSGDEVTASDAAAVDVFSDIIRPCVMEPKEMAGSNFCPSTSVKLVELTGATPSPTNDPDILFNIQGSTVNGVSSVTFDVENPFPAATQLFVQYHKPDGVAGAWSEACDTYDLEACGGTTSTSITADCLEGDGNPFTLVQLYFYDSTAAMVGEEIFGSVTIDECCYPPADAPSTSIAQYSFLIPCSCPSSTSGRTLRAGGDEEDVFADASQWKSLIEAFEQQK